MANTVANVSFILATLVFFLVRYKIVGKGNPRMIMLMPWIYLAFIILINLAFSVTTLNAMCGTVSTMAILQSVVLPWVFIFGTLVVLLNSFPGWKTPFANTIGYLLIASKAKRIMSEVLVHKGSAPKDITQALEYIYNDQSALINELTPDNFDTAMQEMQSSGIFQSSIESYKDKLYDLVRIKDLVSTFIWYILTGFLVQTYGYYQLVSSGCPKTLGQLRVNEQNYMKKLKNQKKVAQKVYTA